MTQDEVTHRLLTFFKALADENRLKIVGLLARESCTVEELATNLALSASTVSHHLSKLAKADLVSAQTDGHYYVYSLHTEALRQMAQNMFSEKNLPGLSVDVDIDAYDRKVLATFTDSEGRITSFPARNKKFLVLLRHVVTVFEPGVRYTEKQVNALLSAFSDDTARLRRGLVDHRFMGREGGGGAYWLLDP